MFGIFRLLRWLVLAALALVIATWIANRAEAGLPALSGAELPVTSPTGVLP